MGVVKEWLLGFAIIVLTVLLLAIGIQIYERSERIADKVIESQDKTLKQEEEYEMTKYDGLPINGSLALNHTKVVVSEYHVPVTVVRGTNEAVVSTSAQFPDLRRLSSPLYLNPMKDYEHSVVRDENDVIVGIRLVEQP